MRILVRIHDCSKVINRYVYWFDTSFWTTLKICDIIVGTFNKYFRSQHLVNIRRTKKIEAREEITWRKRPYNRISRILMQKTSFFRFSSNCPRCYLMMLKRFLGNLRHSKQPPKLLNTSWDHLKKILIEFLTIRSHFLIIGLTEPLKMPIH